MKTNANQNTSTIYYRPLKQWIEVTPEQKRDWERFVGTTREAKQRPGACCINRPGDLQRPAPCQNGRVPLCGVSRF